VLGHAADQTEENQQLFKQGMYSLLHCTRLYVWSERL